MENFDEAKRSYQGRCTGQTVASHFEVLSKSLQDVWGIQSILDQVEQLLEDLPRNRQVMAESARQTGIRSILLQSCYGPCCGGSSNNLLLTCAVAPACSPYHERGIISQHVSHD